MTSLVVFYENLINVEFKMKILYNFDNNQNVVKKYDQ